MARALFTMATTNEVELNREEDTTQSLGFEKERDGVLAAERKADWRQLNLQYILVGNMFCGIICGVHCPSSVYLHHRQSIFDTLKLAFFGTVWGTHSHVKSIRGFGTMAFAPCQLTALGRVRIQIGLSVISSLTT